MFGAFAEDYILWFPYFACIVKSLKIFKCCTKTLSQYMYTVKVIIKEATGNPAAILTQLYIYDGKICEVLLFLKIVNIGFLSLQKEECSKTL